MKMRWLLVSMIACGPLGALALVETPAQGAESAEALIQKGIVLRTNGHDFEALPLFQRAYELAPTPRANAQLGLVEQALGRWPDAEDHIGKALDARRDPWVERNRKLLGQSLATIRQHIGFIEISGEPAGAEVTVNGRSAGRLPLLAPVRVGQGYVEVELAATAYLPARRTINVTGAEAYQLFVKLEPLEPKKALAAPAAPPVVTTQTTAARRPEPASSGSGRGLRFGGLALGVAGAMAVGNGIRLSVRVHDLNGTVHEGDAAGEAAGRAASRGQWISYAVGAGALVAGGILYYLGLAQEPKGPTLALAPLPGGAMGTAGIHF
jgi:hypothetical protein